MTRKSTKPARRSCGLCPSVPRVAHDKILREVAAATRLRYAQIDEDDAGDGGGMQPDEPAAHRRQHTTVYPSSMLHGRLTEQQEEIIGMIDKIIRDVGEERLRRCHAELRGL